VGLGLFLRQFFQHSTMKETARLGQAVTSAMRNRVCRQVTGI
jgi:hypothetical protein